MSSKSLSSVQKPALVRPAVMVASWYRGALGAILLLSAALNVFQLDRVGLGNTYYSTAVGPWPWQQWPLGACRS